MNRKVLKN